MMDKEHILKGLIENTICKEDLNIYLNYLFDEKIQSQIIDEDPKAHAKRLEHLEQYMDYFHTRTEVVDRFNNLEPEDKIAIIKHYKEQGLKIELRPPYMSL